MTVKLHRFRKKQASGILHYRLSVFLCTVENMDRFQPHFGHFSEIKNVIFELSQKAVLSHQISKNTQGTEILHDSMR